MADFDYSQWKGEAHVSRSASDIPASPVPVEADDGKRHKYWVAKKWIADNWNAQGRTDDEKAIKEFAQANCTALYARVNTKQDKSQGVDRRWTLACMATRRSARRLPRIGRDRRLGGSESSNIGLCKGL